MAPFSQHFSARKCYEKRPSTAPRARSSGASKASKTADPVLDAHLSKPRGPGLATRRSTRDPPCSKLRHNAMVPPCGQSCTARNFDWSQARDKVNPRWGTPPYASLSSPQRWSPTLPSIARDARRPGGTLQAWPPPPTEPCSVARRVTHPLRRAGGTFPDFLERITVSAMFLAVRLSLRSPRLIAP